MAQLNTSDFRKGSKVILDGEPYDMLEVNFVKPGKGQALYKCRMKNLLKGSPPTPSRLRNLRAVRKDGIARRA